MDVGFWKKPDMKMTFKWLLLLGTLYNCEKELKVYFENQSLNILYVQYIDTETKSFSVILL